MATALITGIHGFTGRFLAHELRSAGYTIVGLSHDQPNACDTGSVYHQDLRERSGLVDILARVKPDVVAHLAGVSFVLHGDVDSIYRTNVVGTRNLLEALVVSGCKPRSVLLASSANIYGNATIVPIQETAIAAPVNDYAVSKLAMEYVARLWSEQLPITIVRPFNYTGIGQSLNFLLPKIVDHFRRRMPLLELGNLDVVRDFSDVRSVAKRYRLLVEAGQAGEVFNVCSGRGYTLSQVLQIMRDISGHNPDVHVNSTFVRANEVHRLIGSRAKLDAAVGAVPDIPLVETLKWMLDSPV